jgi:putative transcriptional regulator
MTIQFTLRRSSVFPRYPNRIRAYRIRAGLSQRQLAVLVGHGRSLVSAWERGRYLPSLANALRLAGKLNTLAESLYWDLYRPSQEPATEPTPPAT